MVFSDNGASAEGGKDGSVNEHRFTAHLPRVDGRQPGRTTTTGVGSAPTTTTRGPGPGPATRRTSSGSATPGSAGTRTPLIVHWPGRIAQPGDGALAVRPRHRPDCRPSWRRSASRCPTQVDGVPQQVVDGASLLGRAGRPGAPRRSISTQYFEMLGSRSIYHEGWKATTNHISTGVLDEEELAVGSRDFADDRWELFDLDGGLLRSDWTGPTTSRTGCAS